MMLERVIARLDIRPLKAREERMIETLEDVKTDIAQRLAEGAANRKSPMHSPVVASADADVRVMVLRAFDEEAWTLRFHTDARSPKAEAFGGCDNDTGGPVGILLYDFAAKTQIRVRGVARVESKSALAQEAWEASTTFARRCYLAVDAPGAVSDSAISGLPEWAEGLQPSEEQVAPARENFAVLLVEITQIDWLYLANTGHRRAQFERDAGGDWTGKWVVP
jgi:3-hydroxyisobutyrate dehydrogenase